MRRAVLCLGVFAGWGCAAEGGDADSSTGEGDASASSESESDAEESSSGALSTSVSSDEPSTSVEPETAGSGDASTGTPDGSSDDSGNPVEVPPTGADALLPWLQAGEYLDWTAESGAHPSTGPHFGSVRTFVNAPLLDSLVAAGDPHPIDAAAVKELYGAGDEVLGWSVMVKVADGTGGDTWYWLEYYQGSTYADGVGDGLCTGCHGDGTDHVLTPFPLQ